jgi:hypothetical protein
MNKSKKRKVCVTLIIGFFLFLCLSMYIQSCKKLEFEIVARVKTGEISNITTNSASAIGVIQEVGESGISQYGHCWSTDENPEVTLETKTNLGIRNYVGSYKSDLTGLLPGTKYHIRAYAISSGKTIYGDTISFATDADLPTIITESISSITDTTAIGGGHITSDGGSPITARGVCWNTLGNPTTANSKTSNGTGTGTFTSSLIDLTPNITYYVRAYATNSAGTGYGNQIIFNTNSSLPAVITASTSNIKATSAQSGGNVTSVGGSPITARGVCWNTSENPTIANSKTNNGIGIGTFTSSLTSLTPNTIYYVRAYATNSTGTAYGDQVSFTTSHPTSPIVMTTVISSITLTSAQSGGNVTSDEGATVTARGVCWNTSGNPTITDSKTVDGSGTGTFTSNLRYLDTNTTYYVRAYATSSAGTGYGNELSFMTNTIFWQKSLGGSHQDEAYSIQQTNDESYICVGMSYSNDGDVSGNHGSSDYWIVKLNSLGDIDWQKSFGGSWSDHANSIQQTIDGGYIIAGPASSYDGNVSGNHGIEDYWIVKLTSTGNIDWQKSLGGSSGDRAYSIQQTTDRGYIIAGYSRSNDGDVSGNRGDSDYWIVKITETGDIEWQKSLGGSAMDEAHSVQQTTDGGYIIAGNSNSNNGDVSGNHGLFDCWIVKMTSIGNIDWKKSFGGSSTDLAYSIQQTTDGGYIIAGCSSSDDGDVTGNGGPSDYYNERDYWIVKLTSTGDIEWQKSLGGSAQDEAYFIQQTNDGGYIIAGYSNSNNVDVSGNHGDDDYWIVKLTSTGNLDWQKSIGGSDDDKAYSIQQTTDGGYIIAGYSYSCDGDASGNHGGLDYWIVKIIEN